jgi:hypothetical protein
MATIASHHDVTSRKEMTPQTALKYAWAAYLTMLAAPFIFFLVIVWYLMNRDGLTRSELPIVNGWFISAVALIVVAGPAAFFARSRLFRPYWKGECVAPRSYLTGMVIVWAALEVGGLYSLVGAFATRSLFPNLLPALAALMMYVALWPSGRAMVCTGRGDSDDPERYEEPR